jgi:hypothetical protein
MTLAVMAMIQTALPSSLPPADLPGRFVPIQIRHLAVHQDNIIPGFLESSEHLDPIASNVRVVPELSQIAQGNLLIDGIVFGYQMRSFFSERGSADPAEGSICPDRLPVSKPAKLRTRQSSRADCRTGLTPQATMW